MARSGRVSRLPRRATTRLVRTTPPVDEETAGLVPVGEPLHVAGAAVEPQRSTDVEIARLSIDGITFAPLDIAPLTVEPQSARSVEFAGGHQ